MKQNILQSWNDQWPTVCSTTPQNTGEGIIDLSTSTTIELNELFDTVNQAITITGQSVLYRSLIRPLESINEIKAKQEAIKEIQESPSVRNNIENIVIKSAAKEQHLYLLLFGEFLGSMGTARKDYQIEGYGYHQYRRGVRFMLDLAGYIYSSESPSSSYLKEIFNRINTFSQSRVYSLMEGPVYNTEKGLKTKEERKGSFVPCTIFDHIFSNHYSFPLYLR